MTAGKLGSRSVAVALIERQWNPAKSLNIGSKLFSQISGDSDQERDRRGLCQQDAVPPDEKKEMLKELNEALNSVQPIQFPGSIELIRKYYDKIQASLN